jgi:hypothetical protein
MSLRLQLQTSIRDRILRDPWFSVAPLTDAVIAEKRGESATVLAQRLARMRAGVVVGIPRFAGISTPKVPNLILSATFAVECFANPATLSGQAWDCQEAAERVAALMKYVPGLDNAGHWSPCDCDVVDIEEIEESYAEDGDGKLMLEMSTVKCRVEGIQVAFEVG